MHSAAGCSCRASALLVLRHLFSLRNGVAHTMRFQGVMHGAQCSCIGCWVLMMCLSLWVLCHLSSLRDWRPSYHEAAACEMQCTELNAHVFAVGCSCRASALLVLQHLSSLCEGVSHSFGAAVCIAQCLMLVHVILDAHVEPEPQRLGALPSLFAP